MKINKKLPKKKIIIIGASLLVCAVVAVGAYALYHQTKNGGNETTYNPSVTKSDPNVPKPDDNKSNGGISQSQSSTTQNATTPSSSVKPSDPVGIFVSSHHASLGAGAVEQSTCSTTPGAQCQIVFSMNNTKKTLSAQTTDANGNTQWVWNIKDTGLTVGEWTITANATIGSNVSSTNDAMKLEISQ